MKDSISLESNPHVQLNQESSLEMILDPSRNQSAELLGPPVVTEPISQVTPESKSSRATVKRRSTTHSITTKPPTDKFAQS